MFVSQRQVFCANLPMTDVMLMFYNFQRISNLKDNAAYIYSKEYIQKNIFYDVMLSFQGRSMQMCVCTYVGINSSL